MTRHLDDPDHRRTLGDHDRRLFDLERKLRSGGQTAPAPGWVYWEQTFSLDTVAVAASGQYWPAFTGELYEVVASLKTAGTSTTTAVVKVSGGTQATLNLASGDQYEQASLSATLTADTHYATVECTAAGTGAAGLVVTLRFRRRE